MRLIDADQLFYVVKGHHDLYRGATIATDKARRDECLQIMCDINDAPTIDAVPVVRCRECRFNNSEKKCLHPDSIIKIPNDNDFCSYGRRREDGLYESLKCGLEEAIAYENGEVELRTERREDGDV